MQIAIIAGGLAKRLGNLTSDIPKSMLPIHGKPFLEYQIEMLRAQGIADIILCVGHLAEQIECYFGDGRRFGVRIRYSFEHRPMGTAGALKMAKDLLEETFFSLYGDSYVLMDFNSVTSYFMGQDKLALMTVYRNHNRYDKSNTTIEGNMVKFYNKKVKNAKAHYIDYGISILTKEVLDLVPDEGIFGLEDLFPLLIKDNELLAFEVFNRFYEIGSIEGIRDFEAFTTSMLASKNKYDRK